MPYNKIGRLDEPPDDSVEEVLDDYGEQAAAAAAGDWDAEHEAYMQRVEESQRVDRTRAEEQRELALRRWALWKQQVNFGVEVDDALVTAGNLYRTGPNTLSTDPGSRVQRTASDGAAYEVKHAWGGLLTKTAFAAATCVLLLSVTVTPFHPEVVMAAAALVGFVTAGRGYLIDWRRKPVRTRSKPKSFYVGSDGQEYRTVEEYLLGEVRAAYMRDEFDEEELDRRTEAALLGDAHGAGQLFVPIAMERVWK